MLIMPELAVALRRELRDALKEHEHEAIALSTWAKARSGRAEAYVATLRQALEQALPVVLWQRGQWAAATAARTVIGGELTTKEDMDHEGQLWLFETISIPTAVKRRFCLMENARAVGRVLLPVFSPPDENHLQEVAPLPDGTLPNQGMAMGYLFRVSPEERQQEGTPFVRFLPDLYPGEFIVDPHVNFVAAYRYAKTHRHSIPAPGKGRVFTVGQPD